ncbi:MAG: iron ABC transporter permease, partial [Holophagales bacterium]|nr:iron ABC transporter permease [Holophagales bacterium]
MSAAVALVFAADLALGSARVPFAEVARILLGQGASSPGWETIVLHFRLPKALTAVLAGASLAVSGLLMQTLFRNPLAGPYVLGISSGASLGVALVLLLVGAGSATLLSGLGLFGDLAVAAAA